MQVLPDIFEILQFLHAGFSGHCFDFVASSLKYVFVDWRLRKQFEQCC